MFRITTSQLAQLVLAAWIAAGAIGICMILFCRKPRRRDHRCSDCGYDLRGATDRSDRCPECGWQFRGDDPPPRRRWMIISGVLLVLAAAIALMIALLDPNAYVWRWGRPGVGGMTP